MPLSRAERFKLKSGLVDLMNEAQHTWDFDRKNLLLSEFGLETLEGGYNGGPNFEDVVAKISDGDLVEIYAVVAGIDQEEVEAAVESADAGNWKPGYVRLFISHSAQHKSFLGEVAEELAVVGIHGFVAHDTMAFSKSWQAQIEQALRSMQAFVAVVHPEFNESAWCHQEVGWALGRRVPTYVVRMGVDPKGFIGREQWPSGHSRSAKQVAAVISTWASSVPELGETMVSGLFAALASANNYIDAGATADRVATLSGLTEEQWTQLTEIYWENDQLHTGTLPSKALKVFYERHSRGWPPPKPSPPTPQRDPWGASSGPEEPPF